MEISVRLAALVVAGMAIAATAHAQAEFPSRPITIILPASPGATSDLIARALSAPLRARLGQPIIVEAKPGGGGSVASEYTARAAPDGYTIYLAGGSIVSGPIFLKNTQADPIKDFVPIFRFTQWPFVLSVPKQLGVKNMGEFVALVKKNPKKFNYGVVPNSPMQLDIMNLMTASGLDIVEVPFQGAAPIVQAALAQDIQLSFSAYSSIAAHVKEGNLVPLAVTGSARSEIAPDIPTFKEATGVDVAITSWYGFVAPAKTPQPIVDRLYAALKASVAEPDVQKLLRDSGLERVESSPQEMAATLAHDAKLYGDIARKAGIQPQ